MGFSEEGSTEYFLVGLDCAGSQVCVAEIDEVRNVLLSFQEEAALYERFVVVQHALSRGVDRKSTMSESVLNIVELQYFSKVFQCVMGMEGGSSAASNWSRAFCPPRLPSRVGWMRLAAPLTLFPASP